MYEIHRFELMDSFLRESMTTKLNECIRDSYYKGQLKHIYYIEINFNKNTVEFCLPEIIEHIQLKIERNWNVIF